VTYFYGDKPVELSRLAHGPTSEDAQRAAERILAQLDALPSADPSQCECGHAWSQHAPNPTTPDWLECIACQRSCLID
jgi:hypothetical protein